MCWVGRSGHLFGWWWWAGTDLVWVMDMGWASPNLETLAVKKAFGLPATVGVRGGDGQHRLRQACGETSLD